MVSKIKKIKPLFDIRKQNKRNMFIVLVSFLAAFAVAHLYALHFTHYVYIKGYHIHHFYFGTVALALGGILGILNDSHHKRRIEFASALIGIGMGLFADEIGLLLNCTSQNHLCAYAFPDTGDIIMTIAIIIIFLIALADSDIEALKKKYFKNKS
ncbi:MAG: hypothetical protein P4L58_03845 [Candidatus Pacebacteria bacterium]|nr:hypothetical protein [Candidatus Paceibacterota bacterium]